MSVYHKEKPEYLKASIDSMINQSLKPDEIVLVKDGNLNKSLDGVIDYYVTRYPGLFNIISLEKNIGLGKALDVGLKECRNELVARMDTDDISLPQRCEKQVEVFLESPQLSIVGTNIDEFFEDPENIVSSRVVPIKHEDIVRFIKRRSPFNHPTVMYKKSEVLRCGGYGYLRRKQDLDLFSRMINSGCVGMNLDKSLLLFRSNEDNFKRRKSWSYCKSYIDVEYAIWKRGHCTFKDLTFVTIGQLIMFVSPMWLLKQLSNRFLRKTYQS